MNTLEIESKLAVKYGYKPLPEDLSGKYRRFFLENIPEWLNINGAGQPLYSAGGTMITKGYERIVVGDYGAFIEYSDEVANGDHYIIAPGQEYRINNRRYSRNVKYIWYTTDDCCGVKIYYQKKPVTYADYKPGKYYVSVHEAFYSPTLR